VRDDRSSRRRRESHITGHGGRARCPTGAASGALAAGLGAPGRRRIGDQPPGGRDEQGSWKADGHGGGECGGRDQLDFTAGVPPVIRPKPATDGAARPCVSRAAPTRWPRSSARSTGASTQTTGQRRRQHDAGIRDEPLVVEVDRYSIRRHNHRWVVHRVGDLLTRGRGCPFQPQESPAQEVTSVKRPDGSGDLGLAYVNGHLTAGFIAPARPKRRPAARRRSSPPIRSSALDDHLSARRGFALRLRGRPRTREGVGLPDANSGLT
jgi:hypothetical protein